MHSKIMYVWCSIPGINQLHVEIIPIDFCLYCLYFLFLYLYVTESRYEPWCFDQPKLNMCIHLYSADPDHGFYKAIVKGIRFFPST